MADNTLKNTLSEQASNIGSNLDPTHTGSFQAVLRDISRSAYAKQAKSDTKYSALSAAGAKGSDVSGGTFAMVMGNLESMRGGDISKEYAAGVQGYKDTLDALEKKRAEAKSSTTTALENQTKTLALIKGYQDAGLEVPPSLYAAIGTKDPNAPLSPTDMGIQQSIAQSVGQDGFADPNAYLKQKEAYTQQFITGDKNTDTSVQTAQASQDFDTKFSHLLDPKQADKWKSMGINISKDTATSKLAPGTTGSSTIDTTTPGYTTVPIALAGGMTQAQIDTDAWKSALGMPMPPLGQGSSAQTQAKRNAIGARAAELTTGTSVAANKAQLTALTASLTDQMKYQNQMQRSFSTVDDNLKILQDGASKVNNNSSPLVNEWTNLAKTKVIGDGDVNSYRSAIATVRSEYAVMLGKGQSTDATRAESAILIPDNINKTQLQQVLNVLNQEGTNVVNNANQQVASIQDSINNILGGKVVTNQPQSSNAIHTGGTTSSGLTYTLE